MTDNLPLPPGAFMTPDHRYYFNGQGPVPSVTTVLGIMDKPAVVQWKAKESARAMFQALRLGDHGLDWTDGTLQEQEEAAVNWAVKEADKARDTAASLGSSVHLLADLEGMPLGASEAASKGWQVSEQEKVYLEAYRHFLGRYSASNIISSEKVIWSLNGYAGTYDMLMMIPHSASCRAEPLAECKIPQDELELWLIDIKTSKGYYPEYGLQLAGYRWADSIILPGNPEPYPMPQIQRTGVLHLRPDQYSDTGWRLIEYPTTYEKDYMAFLAALELYRWKQEGRFTKSNLVSHNPLAQESNPTASSEVIRT